MWKHWSNKQRFVSIILVLFVLIQFIPAKRTNPPVVAQPRWNSNTTMKYVQNTCYDCHSNETEWPWYSFVAPVSWLVVHDVNEGREHLNFSDINNSEDADEAAEEVFEGEMPMKIYTLMHSHARLTDAERDELVQGLLATFGGELNIEDESAEDDAHGSDHGK